MVKGLSDHQIWDKLVEEDAATFQYIYKKYTPELFTFGCHFTQDQELVKDCIQELFLNLYKNIKRLTSPNNLKYYLLLSMKNQLYMAFRKQKRVSDLEMTELNFVSDTFANTAIEDEETKKEISRKLDKLLNALSPRQKEIIYYRYIQELSIAEICGIMDLRYQSAQNLIQRSLVKMRSCSEVIFVLLTFALKNILFRVSIF